MNKNHPFVSIVIPAKNAGDIIDKCLESLDKLDYPKDRYEVIVADGKSQDKTPLIVEKHRAILILNPDMIVCTGRNVGFEKAKGEIIAFSDADCVMDKNWIKNSIKYFGDPGIGGVGGPNKTPSDETSFGKAVGFIFNQAIFSAGSIHGRILDQTKEIKSLPGCNMIFRREALAKVLPMNKTIYEAEDYIMNQEIRKHGYRLVYTPDTIVWHYRRPTPRRFLRQMQRYGIGRLLIGKKDRSNLNTIHILAGLGIPILIGLSACLILINPLWFVYAISLGILFLFIYFLLAWTKLKSLKSAILVPYAIIILFFGWSSGFLRELLIPIKKHYE